MADKETPNERRLRKESELDKLNPFGISSRYEDRGVIGKAIDKMTDNDDMYGTSASAGARHAGRKLADDMYDKEGATIGETMTSPRVRKAMREAGAEERREARGMKSGGAVSASKRADGIAQRGKTRGKMV